jgi:hypothetical protein
MDVIDYVMVAQLPTHDAQAAILHAQIVMWSFIVFGLGVVMMVNTFAAQALGRGDRRETAASLRLDREQVAPLRVRGLPNLALLAVGLPLYLFHWRTIRREVSL